MSSLFELFGVAREDERVDRLPTERAVDKRRRELGLSSLRTFVIDVISATEASVDAEDAAALRTAKMSSTYIREWIVKQRQEQGPTTVTGGEA